jgi:glycerol-3-phosphate dehydrogenase
MADKFVNCKRLENIGTDYQLVIIGGGIYGAALLWEATHRGVKALLVEQEDYACGASSNSLKTIHGGLRSLQSLNLKGVIKGIRERSIFLRIAPNYVKPLPCVLPSTGSLMKSRPVLGMGLLLYNVLCRTSLLFSANDRSIPNARLLSRVKFLKRASGVNRDRITGGALWYDAQVTNTERLVWQFIKSAMREGAVAVNHAVVLNHKNYGRHKLLIRDQLSGFEQTVTTSAIVDCSAAWNYIGQCLPTSDRDQEVTFLKAVNIVINKKLFDNAVGLTAKTKRAGDSRLYFFSPWRNCTMIGTWYSQVESYPVNSFSYNEAITLVDEANLALGQKLFDTQDICNVHIGYLPAKTSRRDGSSSLDKSLLSHYQLRDWSDQPGMHGVYSLRGTKYTLARYDAKQTIDKLAKTMKWKVGKSLSDHLPIYQSPTLPDNLYLLSPETVDHLLMNYGADIEELFGYIGKNPQSIEFIPGTRHHIRAEIYYTVMFEQALTLSDLLKRRLDIGDCAPPKLITAEYCARIMQELLSWSDETLQKQISQLYESYPEFLMDKGSSGSKTKV